MGRGVSISAVWKIVDRRPVPLFQKHFRVGGGSRQLGDSAGKKIDLISALGPLADGLRDYDGNVSINDCRRRHEDRGTRHSVRSAVRRVRVRGEAKTHRVAAAPIHLKDTYQGPIKRSPWRPLNMVMTARLFPKSMIVRNQ